MSSAGSFVIDLLRGQWHKLSYANSSMVAATSEFLSSAVPGSRSSLPSDLSDLKEKPVLWVLLLSVVAGVSIARYLRSPLRHLPPGPKGVPVLGNLLQLGGKKLWLRLSQWRKQYDAEVLYLNVAGQHLIVVNSQEAVDEILERRAIKNTDRPRNIMCSELLTGGLLFVFTRYNNTWRRMRKAAHEGLNKSVAPRYQPIQASEAVMLAHGLLSEPSEWFKHLRRNGASSVMSVVYDTPPIKSEQDPAVQAVNEFAARLARAGRPGAHLVEFFPWMLYIPSRFAKWKRDAIDWHKKDSEMFLGLYDDVRERVEQGDDRSFTASLVKDGGRHGLSDYEKSWVSASMYVAGSETTAGVMSWWMLAMVTHPEVQKKAQAELDAVVGRDRMPTFADAPHLPYIQAMVKEALRWRPVDPFGLPHHTIEDDWYKGMFIPKNSIIIANVWDLNHQPAVHGDNMMDFDPARFIGADGKVTSDDGHATYGFGRRVCVGRHVADQALFMNIASTLWAVNITPGNNPADVENCFEDGLVVRPADFDCTITPRFPEAAAIVEMEVERIGV